jgi:PKD repeat protein
LRAGFYASSIEGDAPLLVAFANLSSGTPIAQLWTFGDGRISFDVHPTHIYQQNGLYTVTLTIIGEDGHDTRIKEDLIAVGPAAQLATARQMSITDEPVWWLSLVISPWVAGAWLVADRLQDPDVTLPELVRNGRALAALVEAREPETSVGALDLAIERFLSDAHIAQRRSDPTIADLVGASTARVDGLRRALLVEAALRQADPTGEDLGQVAADIQEQLQEFIAAIEALDRESES